MGGIFGLMYRQLTFTPKPLPSNLIFRQLMTYQESFLISVAYQIKRQVKEKFFDNHRTVMCWSRKSIGSLFQVFKHSESAQPESWAA